MQKKIFIFFSLYFQGPPYVRAIGPIKAVAGEDIIVHCPFAGYPIEQIRWEKAHQELTTSKTNCRQGVGQRNLLA